MSHPSLPFQLTLASEELRIEEEVRVRNTKRRIVGLLRLDGDRLRFQLGETQAIAEVTSVGYRTRTDERPVTDQDIPLAELAEARLERRLFGWRLRLTANDLRTLAGLPGARGVELRLPVARAHRERAVELVGAIELALADLALERASRDAPPRLS